MLRLSAAERRLLLARRDEAGRTPPLTAGLEAENLFGTADLPGLRGAETTLSLSGTLERGDKRHARLGLASAHLAALDNTHARRRLDLVAEVDRRYTRWKEQVARCAIARDAQALRAVNAREVADRHQAGAVPISTVHAAQASLRRSELSVSLCAEQIGTARAALTVLWGDPSGGADTIEWAPETDTLLPLPEVPSRDAVVNAVAASPDIGRFIDAERIAESMRRVATAAQRADIGWSAGLRRLEETGDWVLTTGLSMPLGSGRRASTAIAAAEADFDRLRTERDEQLLQLQSAVIEAWGGLATMTREADVMLTEVIPLLTRAESAAAEAWRQGATTFGEWQQAQYELTGAREQLQTLAAGAHQARIELERLTVQPVTARRAPDQDTP